MANLSNSEIEHYVENLRKFPIEEIGSPAWLQQTLNIERLNVCAHAQAANNQFEKVVDAINSFDKFEVLVHELLAVDLWLKNCMSSIKEHSPKMAFARIYMTERSAISIMNLLELVVFHPDDLSSEGLLPLIDFCNNKMAQVLNHDLSELLTENPSEEVRNIFSFGFSSLSIIWCLASCPDISITVTKRLVSEDDVVMTICALIMKQPWRTVRRGKVIKWFNGELKELKPAEALRVCPPEAHAWTSLQQLLEPRCLELTKWNDHRKQAIIDVESLLSEVLIDQLPPLNGLRRMIQYLRVNEVPQPKFSAIIEQYPEMLEEFEKKRDWKKITENAIEKFFNPPMQVLQRELMEISQFFDIYQ
ncbi:zinc finger MYND domain-containing protein 10 [Histomonas meleagridis]|uniref:zinc finger MYND domain-containing protein 10 n=1 Tax=Histomonas meleagridis TaxID=135588 RepID=UPI00355A9945|nr:zinc finger MYND domain-containing protein 10 [Histomonas meleagridis]KAH0801983.1 zinc finger MYND domain-containing protein 10 [Histomonas meleagridis]